MHIQATGDFYLDDSSMVPLTPSGELALPEGRRVYEVLRLIAGTPLFLADHLARLQASAQSAGLQLPPSPEVIADYIDRVVAANGIEALNLRLEWVEQAGGKTRLYVFFIPSAYPTPAMYQAGVEVGFLHWVRANPGAKVWDAAYKAEAARLLQETGFYELLLVDEEDCITEGSRSSVFWVIKDQLWTAPDRQVLAGITRKYVLEFCQQAGIVPIMQALPRRQLAEVDACFLCGTSPKVLPVASISGKAFSSASNPLGQQLIAGFDQMVADYLRRHPRGQGGE